MKRSAWRFLWTAKDIRRKLLITLGILVIYRLAAHVPVPGADRAAIASIMAGGGAAGNCAGGRSPCKKSNLKRQTSKPGFSARVLYATRVLYAPRPGFSLPKLSIGGRFPAWPGLGQTTSSGIDPNRRQ